MLQLSSLPSQIGSCHNSQHCHQQQLHATTVITAISSSFMLQLSSLPSLPAAVLCYNCLCCHQQQYHATTSIIAISSSIMLQLPSLPSAVSCCNFHHCHQQQFHATTSIIAISNSRFMLLLAIAVAGLPPYGRDTQSRDQSKGATF